MPAVTGIVFVVDDDASVRASLTLLMTSAGHVAHGYESADAFLRECPPEAEGCLVLDVTMPGLNGLELQDAIAARKWVLPIVFITGHGDIPATVRAMKAGAVDFLTKPVEADDLLAAVDRALQRGLVERKDAAEIDAPASAVRHPDSEATGSDGAGRVRHAQQAGGGRPGHDREDDQSASRPGHGEDAGEVSRRPRSRGRPARSLVKLV